MIVTSLSNSFNPCPKSTTQKNMSKKKECRSGLQEIKNINKDDLITDFCIMPKSKKYSTVRTKKYCERHEVFFGRAFRNKSIKDGLIVFLTNEDHTGTNGVHGKNGAKLNRYLKKTAQTAWTNYYKKTNDDFIKEYGKSSN